MVSNFELGKIKYVTIVEGTIEKTIRIVQKGWVAIKNYVCQVKAPGLYSDPRSQDTLEWIGLATVVLLFFCILSSVIRYIVLHRSQQIDSYWPVVNTPVPFGTW